MKKNIKPILIDIIVYFAIVFGVTFLWQGLELLMYGEIQHRAVDDIIGIILLFSLLSNYAFLKIFRSFKKNLTDISDTIDKTDNNFSSLYKEAIGLLNILSTIRSCMKVIDKILVDTIDNEDGKETSTAKFTDIKQLATYIKAMNDININYINEVFKSDDENMEKKEGKEEDNDN